MLGIVEDDRTCRSLTWTPSVSREVVAWLTLDEKRLADHGGDQVWIGRRSDRRRICHQRSDRVGLLQVSTRAWSRPSRRDP